MQDQIVSPDWPEPDVVGVGPGETFAFVSGLSGRSIRSQSRCLPTTYPYGCNSEWASIYSTSQSAQYGALFIIFNIGGDPYKAHAYFKNVSGQIIDEFDIVASTAPDDPEPDSPPTPGNSGNGNECQGKSCDPLPDQSNVDCTSDLGQNNPHCQLPDEPDDGEDAAVHGNNCQGNSCDLLPEHSNVDCDSELGQHNPHCQSNTIGR